MARKKKTETAPQLDNTDNAAPVKRGRGRPAGSANLKTREIANRCAETGKTPLEVLLDVTREFLDAAEALRGVDTEGMLRNFKEAAEVASRAAPYIHPKLSAIEHTGADGEKLGGAGAVLVVPQLLDEAAWAAAATAAIPDVVDALPAAEGGEDAP